MHLHSNTRVHFDSDMNYVLGLKGLNERRRFNEMNTISFIC